jgi:catechol 2,3-dioxygenase-like lactoylglutathione lyase family enzyme
MLSSLLHVALLVHEYDEAIDFFVGKLGFSLREDRDLGAGKRWVLVAPCAAGGVELCLARAVTTEQRAVVGKQGGGRVFLFLATDDFDEDHKRLQQRGVRFVRPPSRQDFGTVAVFEDLYGNLWDLIEPTRSYGKDGPSQHPHD